MDFLEKFKEQAPEVVKNNKGALIGALVGWLFTDNKQAQSVIIGAVAGSVLVDKNEKVAGTTTTTKTVDESEE